MAMLTAATLSTSTFAFVILNKDVEVDMFNMDVESDGGLLISLDGKNFKSGVTKEELKNQIAINTGVSYDNLVCKPVTVKQTDGKISYDENNHLVMEKDALNEPVGNDVRQTHKLVDAGKSDYLTIDFYFKVVGNVDLTKNYKLSLSGESSLTGGKVKTVTPKTTLVSNDKSYGPDYDLKTLEVNPLDAMRMAFYHNTENGDEATRMDLTKTSANEIYLVENTLGLGSAAIEERSDEANLERYDIKHDKNKNAMYTYYNNLYPFHNFATAAKDGEAFDTDVLKETDLARFINLGDEYKTLKVSLTIWLEGWDADYFLEADNGLSTFNIFLKFLLKEVE